MCVANNIAAAAAVAYALDPPIFSKVIAFLLNQCKWIESQWEEELYAAGLAIKSYRYMHVAWVCACFQIFAIASTLSIPFQSDVSSSSSSSLLLQTSFSNLQPIDLRWCSGGDDAFIHWCVFCLYGVTWNDQKKNSCIPYKQIPISCQYTRNITILAGTHAHIPMPLHFATVLVVFTSNGHVFYNEGSKQHNQQNNNWNRWCNRYWCNASNETQHTHRSFPPFHSIRSGMGACELVWCVCVCSGNAVTHSE